MGGDSTNRMMRKRRGRINDGGERGGRGGRRGGRGGGRNKKRENVIKKKILHKHSPGHRSRKK